MKDLNMSSNGADITFHTTKLDGILLRYMRRESRSKQPPLFVCNGLGQSLEVLLPILDEIPGRDIIGFDMPGVGRSEMADQIKTIPDYAALAMHLMDDLGIKQFDIMGISWGGALAQQMAFDAPMRVRRLVLAITSAGGIGSWWGTPIALSEIMFPMRYVNKTYGNMIGPWMYGGEALFSPEEFREYSKHAIAPSPEGYFTQVRAMCSWTSLPWLRKITQKTLVIAGQYDGLIPIANQILLSNLMPNARLEVYPAGHLLMYTKRKEVGPKIGHFLSAQTD